MAGELPPTFSYEPSSRPIPQGSPISEQNMTTSASAFVQSAINALLAQKSLKLVSWEPIQTLWAGYGQICRVTASPLLSTNPPSPSTCPTAYISTSASSSESQSNSDVSTPLESQSWILKLVAPPPAIRESDEGHARKILSYQVEQYFYTQLATQMPTEIPVATCLVSTGPSSARLRDQKAELAHATAMLLTDLRASFPVAGEKIAKLSRMQVYAALDWLAGFHGFWWTRTAQFDRERLVRPPLEEMQRVKEEGGDGGGVWLNGGYTYLATRQKEYASLAQDVESEWSDALCSPGAGGELSIAEKVAKVLAPASDGAGATPDYETLIHGDVKSENLFTTIRGDQVAFYDFQYVGLGLGVSDLAKLLTCSVPLKMLVENEEAPDYLGMQQGEKDLLERYQKKIELTSGKKYPWDTFVRHWETALVDWLRFQASWGFWGNTEWLEARVRQILKDGGWESWLDRSLN